MVSSNRIYRPNAAKVGARRWRAAAVALPIAFALTFVGCSDSADGTATASPTEPVATSTSGSPEVASFVGEEYGIAFDYDAGADPFVVTESSADDSGLVVAWSLIRQSDVDATGSNTEGPPGLTIEVFEFDPAPASAAEWVQASGRSNLGLGSGTTEDSVVGGEEAVRYTWSGLYEGTSVVTLHDGRIWMFSATYLEDPTEIEGAFDHLLGSVEFLN